jgi:tetratricopeptide (TPR) repeat protein
VIQHDRGHLTEAEHFYRRALAVEASDGGDPELRRRVLANLGSLLRDTSRPEEALAHLDRARELAGRATPDLAWILGESAAACAALGRTGEAADHYRHALAIWEPLQPESRSLVAETLANLALLHRARGEHAQASALLERAIPLYERELGPESAAVRRARSLLAESAEEAARATAPADLP